MPGVGFEPMIPAFERAKTVHALDGASTVVGCIYISTYILWKVLHFIRGVGLIKG
jgi:hypothetical protein